MFICMLNKSTVELHKIGHPDEMLDSLEKLPVYVILHMTVLMVTLDTIRKFIYLVKNIALTKRVPLNPKCMIFIKIIKNLSICFLQISSLLSWIFLFLLNSIVLIYFQTVNTDNTVGAVGFSTRIAPRLYPVTLIKVDEHTGEHVRDRNGICVKAEPGQSE